jgi:hypothetical protein
MDFKKELSKWGYNKGNSICVDVLVEEILPDIFKRMYSEEEVINLLETQRGNCYVAVLSATKNDELASIALNAPEPGGMKKLKNK